MTKKKAQLFWLCPFIITIINVGTLCFVPLLSANLSDLGNTYGHRIYLLLWAITAALTFSYFTRKLMMFHNYPYRIGITALYITCFCMVISVAIPYLPNQYPTLAKWHIRIAMFGTVGYIITFFHYIIYTMKCDTTFYQKYSSIYLSLIAFDSLLYLWHGGVSTLLEISFTIFMSILLTHMYITIKIIE